MREEKILFELLIIKDYTQILIYINTFLLTIFYNNNHNSKDLKNDNFKLYEIRT